MLPGGGPDLFPGRSLLEQFTKLGFPMVQLGPLARWRPRRLLPDATKPTPEAHKSSAHEPKLDLALENPNISVSSRFRSRSKMVSRSFHSRQSQELVITKINFL